MKIDCKIYQNYFPLINEGHTMQMSAAIDPTRLYTRPAILTLSGLGIFPVFDFDLPMDNYYGEYLVLWIGDDILEATMDCDIIISLN